MVKEQTSNDEVIEEYLKSCRRLVESIKKGSDKKEKNKPEVKKKEQTKIKNKYPIIIPLKVACFIGVILVFGSLLASIIVPDVIGAIMAFIESLDPFKHLKGGNALDPSHYVMTLKNKLWL